MSYSLKRLKRILCLRAVEHLPLINGCMRARFAKWGG